MMQNHVIVVPGLGDTKSTYGQPLALALWRLYGVRAHFFPLGWSRKEGYDTKQARLDAYVQELVSRGHRVSLVGISAGASAVLNSYAKHPEIHRVVCICGKINNPQTIGAPYFEANPDFEASVFAVKQSLEEIGERRVRILSTHPWRDQVVPIRDTIVPNANNIRLPGWGHVSGIFFALTLGGPKIARFIKKA